MIETNKVRMMGVLPSQGADPILVSMDFPANMCRIKTGTYTGDGEGGAGQAITGVGFAPKYVKIWNRPTGVTSGRSTEKTDQTYGTLCFQHYEDPTYHYYVDNRILSLDADGFTISDAGTNLHPNALGIVYEYLVLG